jgi:2-polyprenyl-3-methyl-5-hydroxy-6-metoxy-1,4-benzoquinol methylase
MAYASNRGMLLRMQSPIDPHDESGLVSELLCGGITALVAERIVERKGEPMPTTAEPHTHSAPPSGGAPPSPEPLMHMIQGLQVAGILKGAVDLGVFDEIAAGRGDAGSIATATGADARATRVLLDALAALGLLTAGPDYGLAPIADEFLVRNRRTYIGGATDIFTGTWAWENYGRIAEIVRNGGTIMQQDAETPGLEFWTTFAGSSGGIATPQGQGLADVLAPWTQARDALAVLDVACGSGLYGLAIAGTHPAARLTLLDWGNVLETARRNVTSFGLEDRTDYVDGDAFETDLGGPYDLIIASHFFHHFSEARCRQALKRFAAALKPGGRIAINEFTTTAENPADDPFPALFSVVMLAWTRDGSSHTVADYTRWLNDCGFAAPEIHDGRGLPSRFIIAEREA